jgi:FtsP/CotA-like multicopper oxidase with cupredoxin domain
MILQLQPIPTFSVFYGFPKSILSINDQYPPPTIIVNQGDMINITVINESPEPTAIHWHGLKQEQSLHMDGVPGVTQCEILPASPTSISTPRKINREHSGTIRIPACSTAKV